MKDKTNNGIQRTKVTQSNDSIRSKGHKAVAEAPKALLLEAMDLFLHDVRKKKLSLSALQLLIALYLLDDKSARLNQLAKTIGVTSGGVTGVADHLDRMGLAVRVTDPEDRRAILMKLTPDGVRYAELIENSLSTCMGNAFFKRVTSP